MIRWLVASLALLAAAPGTTAGMAPLRVTATSADLKALVEAVGGDQVAVESLASPEQDPHGIELKPAQIARLREARLVVRIGLDHEPWLQRARIPEATAVVDLSRSVTLLQSHTPRLRAARAAHVHAFGNTHYWLDPENARPITAAIVEALAKAGAEPDYLSARRNAFLAQLDARLPEWQRALEPHRGSRVVVMHDTWAYFAERFGLRIVAAVEPTPGVPPSPAELAALFARMREAKVQVLIADPHSNAALARQVAERTGARAVTLMPSGSDYLRLIDGNVARLAQALDAR